MGTCRVMASATSSQQQCSVCGASGSVKRCSVCKEVYYCGVACQKADLTRHRQQDGCGKRTPSSSSTPARTEDQPAAAAAPKTAAATSGPPCQRCRAPAGEEAEQVFANIAQRSIFGSPDCQHGPFCARCVERMQRLTLAFCPGCGALIGNLKDPSSASPMAVEGSEVAETREGGGGNILDRLD
ncbi:unnamed protein product [Polarella glacialis]|uniref:MYND-type domain-containing protein n=1 Tax=Polarella glacialis TaxID=89957 RepID=A0A813IRI1_POLGL|nr:unnamed protein product [Polarella glacialis]CAE8654791.1 unnamed protein product [Polarella glacialis]|mmetsp:Transcript_70492/g.113647  ORF Transcript_70492/g.113647 Transcript_70492/m.113647 type:complete len:184 (-) Transcript_70492:109-660(-)